MSIFNHFQNINLTDDQRKALEQIQVFITGNNNVFVLQGYAGSGKTTIIKGLTEYLESVEKTYQLMAPTGRVDIPEATTRESGVYHPG